MCSKVLKQNPKLSSTKTDLSLSQPKKKIKIAREDFASARFQDKNFPEAPGNGKGRSNEHYDDKSNIH